LKETSPGYYPRLFEIKSFFQITNMGSENDDYVQNILIDADPVVPHIETKDGKEYDRMRIF
jgi:hypothetical protein